jgi:hypothetical protein
VLTVDSPNTHADKPAYEHDIAGQLRGRFMYVKSATAARRTLCTTPAP